MIKDLKQVNVPNEIIAQLSTLKKLEIDTVIALFGEINQNVAKLQIIKKDNNKYYQDNVSVNFELRNVELKKDINSNTKSNLTKVLLNLSDMLYPVELEKVNNTTIKVKYSCSIKDKEVGKMYDEGEYTKINLANLLVLTGKYDKLLYILMFKHSNVGLIHMNMDTLADLFNSNISQMRVLKSRINKAINNISALLDNDKVQLVNSLTWETENITGHDRVKGINLSFNKLALNNKVSENKKKEPKVTETRNVNNNDEKDKEIAMLKAQLARKERQVEELTKLVANPAPVQGLTEERLHVIPLKKTEDEINDDYDNLSTWEKIERREELDKFFEDNFNDDNNTDLTNNKETTTSSAFDTNKGNDFEDNLEKDDGFDAFEDFLKQNYANSQDDDFSDLSSEHQKQLGENAERAKVALATNDIDMDDIPF